jgi:hypothetical protein
MDHRSRLGLEKLDKMTKVSYNYHIILVLDSPQPRWALISSPSIKLKDSKRPDTNDQCTSPWRLSWQCPGTQIFWRINVTKTRVSEDGRWSRVPVAGTQKWQSGLLRPGRLNLRRVMMTLQRERGHHRQSTAWENSMEVETNYTCLAFWGQKAATVKTSPRRG